MSNFEHLMQFDSEHVWHPYTSLPAKYPLYFVEKAKGSKITLHDGTILIDGMSSWWTSLHGYNHPELNEALVKQAEKMSHVMFGGLTHQPAIELAELLISITPSSLQKVFLADSGSISVEVALKMALQYHHALGNKRKTKFLSFRNSYHGDTLFAMSVSDPETGMHEVFRDVIPVNYFASAPQAKFNQPALDSDIESVKTILDEKHESIAAVIIEPVVQGAGGMRFYSPQFLDELSALCRTYNVLLIFDEIATGFGRSGKLFACLYSQSIPDILCLGKALTGGYITLAATLTSNEVSETISKGKPGLFMHGPTYMANPLACAVGLASTKLLLSTPWKNKVFEIEKIMNTHLSACVHLEGVADVRVLGAIGVVEMKNPLEMKIIQPEFVKRGIWVRPFGKLIYIMPAFNIDKQDLIALCKGIYEVIDFMKILYKAQS